MDVIRVEGSGRMKRTFTFLVFFSPSFLFSTGGLGMDGG